MAELIEWDKVNERLDMIQRARNLFVSGDITQEQMTALVDKVRVELQTLLGFVPPEE